MSSTKLDISSYLNSVETLTEAEAPSASTDAERRITQSKYGYTKTINGATTPSITSPPIITTLEMTGSPVTLNLASGIGLSIGGTRTINLTGKKAVAIKFIPHGDNDDPINVAPGASNPYPIFGTAKDIDLEPGQETMTFFRDVPSTLPDVGASVRTIDFDGTAGDKIDVQIFAGA